MTTNAPADIAHAPLSFGRLRRRQEFLNVAKSGVRASGPLFTIQMADQDRTVLSKTMAAAPLDSPPRFGLTVTKKVAGAVGRNRIRRRLRAALRGCAQGVGGPDGLGPDGLGPGGLGPGGLGPGGPGPGGLGARAGQDYVILARREALNAPFAEILSQMAEGFARLQDRKAARCRRNQTEKTGVPRDE